MKKAITITLTVLIILIIPLIIYLLNFKLVLFNTSFYEQEFEKQGVYEEFGKEKVDDVNSELLAYFKDGKKNNLVDTDFFELEEKKHLLDVKNTVQKTSILLIILVGSVVVLLIILALANLEEFTGKLAIVFILGGALTVVITLAIFLLAKLNFDLLFTFMHTMLFEEGTWLFPEGSNLIGIYPAGFFYDSSIKIFFNSAIHGFVLAFIASFYPNKRKLFKRSE
jgi:integral membrane protein (TIGR01906 family)